MAIVAIALVPSGARSAEQDAAGGPTLEETRLAIGKWIETQQIISKERKDWQQGKDILVSRLELVRKEVATLKEKIATGAAGIAEVDRRKAELLGENDVLKAAGAQLTQAVTGMEAELRRLLPGMPEPIRVRLEPLTQRIPADPAQTQVSIAERFQNALGILNELNKANTEVTVNYEVRTLADGSSSEVQAIYVGLAQAYYVSGGGEAGIGRPSEKGWQWEPSNGIANDVLRALEILQGKQTPAFVPLPVKIQ